MAFSGLHVVCAYAGSKTPQRDPAATLGCPIWTERLAANGTTAKAAPGHDANGDPVFHLYAAAEGYAVIGTDPNAAGTTEVFVPSGEFVTVYVRAGYKLKWVAA